MEKITSKASETEVVINKSEDRVISYDTLKANHEAAVADLTSFEAWVTAERSAREKRIADASALLGQAENLGVGLAEEIKP